jgi:hypothetical protein
MSSSFFNSSGAYTQVDPAAIRNLKDEAEAFAGASATSAAASAASAASVAALIVAATALTRTERAEVSPGMTLSVFGDSISVGTGASNATKFGWNYLLANRLGLTHNNWSSSGKGSNYALAQAFVHQAPYGRRGDVSVWMPYHNDVYRGGSATKTIEKIKGECRAFLANSFLSSAVPINDASVTKTGTWANGSNINEKAVTLNAGAGRLMYSSTIGDTLSWTFSGDNLVVGLFNTDGLYHYGNLSVSVDGATSGNGFATFTGENKADGIPDGVYDNKITHNALVLTGLGTGTHTVVLTVTGNLGPVYVDYFGTMLAETYSSPVIITEAPRPNTVGYSLGGNLWSPAAFDAADAAVRAVVAEFYNRPITITKTNQWLNASTGIGVDNEHPNDLGHSQIAASIQEGIQVKSATFIPTTMVTRSSNQSIANASYVSISWTTATPDDNKLFSAGNPTRITFPYAGTSRIEGHFGFANNSTGIREAFLFKNGVSLRMIATSPALAGDNTVMCFTSLVTHAAGDYIELKAIQSSGGALDCDASQTQMVITQVR